MYIFLRNFTFILTLFALFACSDDTTTGPDSSSNGLAIFLERTAGEQGEVTQGRFAETEQEVGTVRFCYAGEGCEEGDSGSRSGWGSERRMLDQSDPDKEAVGIIVEFHVEEGEGFAEIIRGDSYENEDGFRQFNEEDVVLTSDPFTEGDIVSFEYGDTE